MTPKAVERMFAKRRCEDIPIYWSDDDTEVTTQVEVPRPHASNDNGLKTVLICPDTHRPFHDKRAWSLFLDVGRTLRPDCLAVIGDFADFYAVSSHSKNPLRSVRHADEVGDVNVGLDELDSIGAKRRIFVGGNHEHRWQRWLEEKAPQIAAMPGMNVESMFRLPQRGWEYIPYKSYAQIGNLYLTHDAGDAGLLAANRAKATFGASVIIGHTHRVTAFWSGDAQGNTMLGASIGWLGSREDADYMHRIKAQRDWCLGFGWAVVEPDGTAHVQPVPIITSGDRYRCVVAGRYFEERRAAA